MKFTHNTETHGIKPPTTQPRPPKPPSKNPVNCSDIERKIKMNIEKYDKLEEIKQKLLNKLEYITIQIRYNQLEFNNLIKELEDVENTQMKDERI